MAMRAGFYTLDTALEVANPVLSRGRHGETLGVGSCCHPSAFLRRSRNILRPTSTSARTSCNRCSQDAASLRGVDNIALGAFAVRDVAARESSNKTNRLERSKPHQHCEIICICALCLGRCS